MQPKERLVKIINWKQAIDLHVEDVQSVKIGWLIYKTDSVDNYFIQLKLSNFPKIGQYNRNDGSTFDYFYCQPLDPQPDVVCLNSGTEQPMRYFDNKISLFRSELEIYINDNPAYDITASNPLYISFLFM